jgi:hypothetical protein
VRASDREGDIVTTTLEHAMYRRLVRTLVPASVAVAAAALVPPSYADPVADTGSQTSICDNGETYVFSLRDVGNGDLAKAFEHTPIHDPASNTVLTPISSSGTVTIDDGESTQSFPYSFGGPRSEKSGHVTTCASTFDVWYGPVHVHVDSVDVVLVSGRR